MTTSKPPKTAAATATRVRAGQETMARKLRAAGWFVAGPEIDSDQIYYLAKFGYVPTDTQLREWLEVISS